MCSSFINKWNLESDRQNCHFCCNLGHGLSVSIADFITLLSLATKQRMVVSGADVLFLKCDNKDALPFLNGCVVHWRELVFRPEPVDWIINSLNKTGNL
jgi:hypothetical protein